MLNISSLKNKEIIRSLLSSSEDPEEALSQNLFLFTQLSVATITLFFSISYAIYEMYAISIAQILITITAISGIIYFQRTKRIREPIHLVLLVTWIASIFRVYKMGGVSAPTFYTYTIIPVYGAAVLGAFGAVFWTALFVSVPIAFHYADLSGAVFAASYSNETLASARIWGIVLANIVVLVVAIYVKSVFKKYRILVEKERDEKTSLLRLVSHDVSNPLTILSLTIGNIKKEARENSPLERSVQRCELAILRISKIVDNIKKVEALRAGKIIPSKEKSSTQTLAQTLIDYASPLLEKKELELKVNASEQSIEFLCDSDLIQSQIIGNLLGNAIKFSDPRSIILVNLSISANSLLISIQDFGIGIPKESLPFIFSTDRPTSQVGTGGELGTGFGLPIVKSVVQVLNGTISVSSRSRVDNSLPTGTHFTVELPVEVI